MKRPSLPAALLIFAANSAAAEEHKWQPVPGYPKLFVDLNSIRSQNTEVVCHNPPFIPVDTTVDIRRNGRQGFLWLNCKPPRCVDIEISKEDRAVMALVCPARPPG